MIALEGDIHQGLNEDFARNIILHDLLQFKTFSYCLYQNQAQIHLLVFRIFIIIHLEFQIEVFFQNPQIKHLLK